MTEFILKFICGVGEKRGQNSEKLLKKMEKNTRNEFGIQNLWFGQKLKVK